jgi:hypothetical protein
MLVLPITPGGSTTIIARLVLDPLGLSVRPKAALISAPASASRVPTH